MFESFFFFFIFYCIFGYACIVILHCKIECIIYIQLSWPREIIIFASKLCESSVNFSSTCNVNNSLIFVLNGRHYVQFASYTTRSKNLNTKHARACIDNAPKVNGTASSLFLALLIQTKIYSGNFPEYLNTVTWTHIHKLFWKLIRHFVTRQA